MKRFKKLLNLTTKTTRNFRRRGFKKTNYYKDGYNCILSTNIKVMNFSGGTSGWTYDLQGNLWTAHQFDTLCDVFQQYKLNKIRADISPVAVSGNDPPAGYCYLYVNEDEYDTQNPNYVPMLQSSKKISPKHDSAYSFRVPGRQNDFNYWYNTLSTGSQITAYLVFKFSATNVPSYYQLRIRYYLSFRYRTYESPTTKLPDEEKFEYDDGGIPKARILKEIKINKTVMHEKGNEQQVTETDKEDIVECSSN
jgi:hypothetical protein